jgi:voltage-gated potassium channel Kch
MTTVREPTTRVEIAFSAGASTSTLLHLDDPTRGILDTGTLGTDSSEDPVWTDVTPYFRSGSITRGSRRIESPIITYETGTCAIVLGDPDRRFDPDNLDGPYVSGGETQVTAMRAIRVLAEWAGITYEMYRGFIDNWDLTWIDPGDCEVVVTASDGFKVLAGNSRTAGGPIGGSETTGARINRVLDSANWPAADRIIATGQSTVQATTLDGSALSELQLTADAEIGELYMDGGGRVVFRNRHALLTETRSNTSQASFGDTGAELPYTDLKSAADDGTFYNQMKVTRAGGTEQIAEDTASQALLYTRTFRPSGEPILETDAAALDYAQWLLHISRTPETRFTTMVVDPRLQPDDLYPHVLGRQIGDRITATRRPPGGGDPIVRDVFVRGIEHRWSAQDWSTTWTFQAASKFGSFLTLDNPTLGVLDANALAY